MKDKIYSSNLFPYSDIITKEIESWKSYADCLRKQDRKLFYEMLNSCYKYSSAITVKGKVFSTSVIILILLEHHKQLALETKEDEWFIKEIIRKITISGWLFDAYYSADGSKMIFWIRIKDSANDKKKYIRIEDEWQNYFYLASNDILKLKEIIQNVCISSSIISHEFVKRFEKITDTKKTCSKSFYCWQKLKVNKYH